MFDWNGNGERDSFDLAMNLMVLDEVENAEAGAEDGDSLDFDLLGTGYDRFDLEMMDDEERREVLEEAGLDADDYDFD